MFGEVAGWERANWFAREGQEREYRYSWKRQNWFDNQREEHLAVRNGVGLFDMTSFGKIRVEGRDACAFLQRLCANDMDVAPGKIVYTQMLNQRGGIESDLTVSRLSETAYFLVVPGATLQRDLAWLRKHLADEFVVITDVTAAEAVLCLMGPDARKLIQKVSPNDFSNETNPFGTFQEIEIGMGLARAHRVTYVGELGWELYVSTDQAAHVFEAIDDAGADVGLKLCGLHTLDSCRIEKAFRHFGHDITDEDHVLEAGLGFAVKTAKGDFLGRDAVLKKKEAGLSPPACAVPPERRATLALPQRGDPARRQDRRPDHLGQLRPSSRWRRRAGLRALQGRERGGRAGLVLRDRDRRRALRRRSLAEADV